MRFWLRRSPPVTGTPPPTAERTKHRMERVHGEAGWMIRGLTAVVVVGVLATARPERSWAWGILGVGFLAWLAGSHLMTRDQRWSLVLLVFAGISASLIVGMPGANALVIALVALI